jgi:hypothetical protein
MGKFKEKLDIWCLAAYQQHSQNLQHLCEKAPIQKPPPPWQKMQELLAQFLHFLPRVVVVFGGPFRKDVAVLVTVVGRQPDTRCPVSL